jgi:hypothetical protein
MAYTTIDNPELYFQAVTYTGNSSDGNAITLDGDENLSPNLIWIATRNNTMSKRVYDSVRGVNAALLSDTDVAEDQYAAYGQFESFDSDGFTLGVGTNSDGTQGHGSNTTGHTYVAWCWNESATAGFDIVSYTGSGSNRTVSHGLGSAIKFLWVKNRDDGGENHTIWHQDIANTHALFLNHTSISESYTTRWNSTTPTSSVFTVGTSNGVNGNTKDYIAYCFAEKQGFSKFGKYEGNNDADGPFVYTGFKPAFVLLKDIDATNNWGILDNKRASFNEISAMMNPNVDGTEGANNEVDFLSNGFKLRSADGNSNAAETYVYAAFAEQPFVNSNGVPCNAR